MRKNNFLNRFMNAMKYRNGGKVGLNKYLPQYLGQIPSEAPASIPEGYREQYHGKDLVTSKSAYNKGKIIGEDEHTVTVQLPKSPGLLQMLDKNIGIKMGDVDKYGHMLNQVNLEQGVTKSNLPGEKDTLWTTAGPIKHKFTKPVNFDFPVKKSNR